MSFYALSAVIDNSQQEKLTGMKVSERCILMLLAYRHNADTGQCNPRIKRISSETGLSRAAVLANLKKLEQRGVIIRHPSGRGSQYDLLVESPGGQPRTGPDSGPSTVQIASTNGPDSGPPLRRTGIELKTRSKSAKTKRLEPPSWSIVDYEIPESMPFNMTDPVSTGYGVWLALQDWLDFRRLVKRKSYVTSKWIIEIWNRVEKDPGRLITAIKLSIAREWQGIYEENGSRSQKRHAAPPQVDPGRRKITTRRIST